MELKLFTDLIDALGKVAGGLKALVKAKMDGFQQTIKILTGTYARPIPPAAHKMPPADQICMKCHDPARQNADLLLTRSNYGLDRDNTEQRTALVVRLSGDEEQKTQGQRVQDVSSLLTKAEGNRLKLESRYKFLAEPNRDPLAYFLDKSDVQKIYLGLMDVQAQEASPGG